MDIATNIAEAFNGLGNRVHQALRVQRGDVAQLCAQRDEVRLFIHDVERVRTTIHK